MAVIRDIYEIADRFSAPLRRAAQLGDRAAGSMSTVNKRLREMPGAATMAGSALTRIGGLIASAAAVRGFVQMSDELTNIGARLNAINDGLQTTAELNDMIFQSAQNARGSYVDMAANVASLKAQTGDTFKSVAEAVRFTELLNKQFVISGTSASGVASTMYNLTQALATGVLRGNDLQMILSNSPALIQKVADYMGITIGELREIAKDGDVTADIVKNAIMGAAEDIDTAFEKMPYTFAQSMQKLKNEGVRALQPLSDAFSEIVNSDAFTSILDAIATGITILANIAQVAFGAISAVVEFASNHLTELISVLWAVGIVFAVVQARAIAAALASFAAWAIVNLPFIALITVIALVINHLISIGVTFSKIGQFIGELMAFVFSVVDSCFTALYNTVAVFFEFLANVWVDPLNAMVQAFIDAFDVILQMIENVAAAIDAMTGSKLSGAVTSFRGKLQDWAKDNLKEKPVDLGRRQNTDPATVVNLMGQKGAELGSKIDNLAVNIGDAFEPLDWNKYGDFGASGAAPDVGTVGKVKKVENVKLSDEDMKIYRDLAERKYLNNVELQTLAPNISVSIPESAAKNLTSQDIADKLKVMLIEQAARHTATAHAV